MRKFFFVLICLIIYLSNYSSSVYAAECKLLNPNQPLPNDAKSIDFAVDIIGVRDLLAKNQKPPGGTLKFSFPGTTCDSVLPPPIPVSDPNKVPSVMNWSKEREYAPFQCGQQLLWEGDHTLNILYTYTVGSNSITDTMCGQDLKYSVLPNPSNTKNCELEVKTIGPGDPTSTWDVYLNKFHDPNDGGYWHLELVSLNVGNNSGKDYGSFWNDFASKTNSYTLPLKLATINNLGPGDYSVGMYNSLKYNPTDNLACQWTIKVYDKGITASPMPSPSPVPPTPDYCDQRGTCRDYPDENILFCKNKTPDCSKCSYCWPTPIPTGRATPNIQIPDLKPLCDQLPTENDYRGKCWVCQHEGGIWSAIGCLPTDFSALVNKYVFTTGVGLAGGIAFIYFLYGAFLIMTSSGNAEKMEEAKQIITSSLAGLILIIFSVFLLQVIGVQVLKLPGFG